MDNEYKQGKNGSVVILLYLFCMFSVIRPRKKNIWLEAMIEEGVKPQPSQQRSIMARGWMALLLLGACLVLGEVQDTGVAKARVEVRL